MKTIKFLFAFLFAVGLNTSYAQNTWIRKADCGGLGRWLAVGFSIGSKGYIGTGVNGTSTFLSDLWEYDPSTNAWTQKADFGGGLRYAATGFSISNKGYIGTGSNNSGIYYKDFWEYDPASNAWTRKADFGGAARYVAVGFSIGDKGYLGNGNNPDQSVYYKDFWEYDPVTDVWTQKTDFGGVGRRSAVGFSIGSKGYLGTGEGNYKDFWEYDPATNLWTRKADFGGGERYASVGFSIGTKGYIGLGFSDLNDFWEYDPSTDAWTQKADFGGTGRAYATGFSIGNKGYMGTGVYPVGVKDFWEYTPENTCPAPTGMKVQAISGDSAILKWQVAGADILHVRVRYRIVGGTAWAIKNKNGANPSVHINGLMPNTTYQWQLRSFCAEDTSGWVAGPDFTTTASFASSSTTSAIISNKLPGNIHVQIMPNPNKGNFTIHLQLPSKAAITTLALYNSMGEKKWQQDAGKMSGAVSRNIALESKLSTGVYVLMIQHGDSRLMQKVMVTK